MKEVNLEDFIGLLHLFYSKDHIINSLGDKYYKQWRFAENNVETQLALADRFDVQHATDQCEDWLREADDVDLKKKIALADKFKLRFLKVSLSQCGIRVRRPPSTRSPRCP